MSSTRCGSEGDGAAQWEVLCSAVTAKVEVKGNAWLRFVKGLCWRAESSQLRAGVWVGGIHRGWNTAHITAKCSGGWEKIPAPKHRGLSKVEFKDSEGKGA